MRASISITTVVAATAGIVAVGLAAPASAAGPVNSKPVTTTDHWDLDCGGELGPVVIPGGRSGTGFTPGGELYRLQLGQMKGLEGGYTCLDEYPLVRVR
jgi:hypothetical protein